MQTDETCLIARILDGHAEDFGYFTQAVPGAFYWIGVGNPDIGAVHPIHSPRFIADEAALVNLIALHTALAMKRY